MTFRYIQTPAFARRIRSIRERFFSRDARLWPIFADPALCPGHLITQIREGWNKDILAIEKLIKDIEADNNPPPVLSIKEFTAGK